MGLLSFAVSKPRFIRKRGKMLLYEINELTDSVLAIGTRVIVKAVSGDIQHPLVGTVQMVLKIDWNTTYFTGVPCYHLSGVGKECCSWGSDIDLLDPEANLVTCFKCQNQTAEPTKYDWRLCDRNWVCPNCVSS